uniref:FIIND domain-containing protein n=1 Tax=Chelydra serpentina TaxID=8475 RepID=A0A8C3XTI5_CHESE
SQELCRVHLALLNLALSSPFLSVPCRVHLPGAGSFRCSETELGFEVRAAVTVQYRYDSWDQHLREWSTPEWLVIGPLFNIQAEPATAVAAVHLPHFLCLAGTVTDISQMRIIHFTDEGMTLEEPTGVRPSHVVLENPSFSLYGVIFICLSCLRIPVHSLVLIYQALRLADTTLHLYLIPNDWISSLRILLWKVHSPSH